MNNLSSSSQIVLLVVIFVVVAAAFAADPKMTAIFFNLKLFFVPSSKSSQKPLINNPRDKRPRSNFAAGLRRKLMKEKKREKDYGYARHGRRYLSFLPYLLSNSKYTKFQRRGGWLSEGKRVKEFSTCLNTGLSSSLFP